QSKSSHVRRDSGNDNSIPLQLRLLRTAASSTTCRDTSSPVWRRIRARRDRCHLYFFFRDARKSAAVVGPLTNVSSCEAMYWRKLRKKSAPVGSPSFSQDAFNAAAFSGGVSAG